MREVDLHIDWANGDGYIRDHNTHETLAQLGPYSGYQRQADAWNQLYKHAKARGWKIVRPERPYWDADGIHPDDRKAS